MEEREREINTITGKENKLQLKQINHQERDIIKYITSITINDSILY